MSLSTGFSSTNVLEKSQFSANTTEISAAPPVRPSSTSTLLQMRTDLMPEVVDYNMWSQQPGSSSLLINNNTMLKRPRSSLVLKRHGSSLVLLPHDVVELILERLAVKSLLRFKSVSKKWESTIESQRFKERQLIRASFVVNPATGWHKSFPLSNVQKLLSNMYKGREKHAPCLQLGFGKDKFKGTYKPVLLCNSSEYGLANATTCEVFDFTTNSWRYVLPASPYRIFHWNQKPVYFDGSLYWLTEGEEETKVISFDLHTETFQVICKAPFPYAPYRFGVLSVILCILDNRFLWKPQDLRFWIKCFVPTSQGRWTPSYTVWNSQLRCSFKHGLANSQLGYINYHPKTSGLSISHLMFADDVMIFFDGTEASLHGINEALDDFASWSGLHMNRDKTQLFHAGLNLLKSSAIARHGFPVAALPIRYLGLPLMHRKLKICLMVLRDTVIRIKHLVTEKKEEQPAAINAFEIISMSRGLNLENLFDPEQRETRITLRGGADEIIEKIEEAAKPLDFDVQKRNYKMMLENVKAGKKGNLNVATEVYYLRLDIQESVDIPSSAKSSYGSLIQVERRHSRIPQAKTNPLADIGVDFEAINRREKWLEKPTNTPAMRPPPNPMTGSGMPMGGGMDAWRYEPHGYGYETRHEHGQGYPMQPQNPGMVPGPNMPGNNYNPMMGQGGYNPQQSYGGGYR
ncbi:NAF/FISL domain [Arabidopsis suecica]|uniref:NAF/FISL domain n=1 Tax=Arabidopsis suecica TaxID=45249 RepID=A0A8T2AGD5_ARASU|nr:NAF/FISL domain [Arabidopsis suecica]